MTWYRKLGFYNNPFSIKPATLQNSVVAYDMPFIYDKIDNAETVFIEGEYGTGKTTILKNIIRRYQGKNKIIYYSFNTGVFNIRVLIEGANSFLRKVSGLRVRNIIMLLDEVHSMTVKDAKNLLKHYSEGTIQSIIFVSHDYDKVNFPEDFKPLLNGNILRTIDLTDKEAIELIKSRIGDIELFSDTVLKKIYRRAKNPRRFLEYCEDVARYAVEMGDMEVTDFHIDEVLGDIKLKVAKKVVKPVKKEVKKQVKKPAEEPVVKEVQITEKKVVEPVEEAPSIKKEVEKEPVEEKVRAIEKEVEKEPVDVVSQVKVVQEEPEEIKIDADKKKFKVNKLVGNSKTNPLGEVGENDEEEVPEYKVYFFDE